MIKTKLKNNGFWIVTYLLIAIKLCLHFYTNTNYELHRDEMLYFNMADHLSFGYATVPPVIGLFAFIIKTLFGYSVFGIRLIPALLGAASIFIISRIVKEMGGGTLALIIAGFAFLLSPGFLLFDTLFTPNVIEQFLWLLITWYIFRMVRLNKPQLWILIGALLGIAFMNKYSVLFFITGFFIAMFFSPYRKLLNSRYFYWSLAIGVFLILPNIAWQFLNSWPVIYHMGELNLTQMATMTYTNYFVDIFTLNSVSTIVWLIGLFSLIFLKKEKIFRFIGVASLIIILLFLLLKGKGYYILGLIPFLFAAGGCAMEYYLKKRLIWVSYFILFVSVIASLATMPFGLPLLSFEKLNKYREKTESFIIYPFYRWEDGKVHNISQVYSDMTGWSELAGYVSKAYHQLTIAEQNKCTIYAERNYGNAGAIHFYGREYGIPEPVTFLESYVFWAPDTIPNGPFIYINGDKEGIKALFGNITEVGCVNNNYFRENGLKVFVCKSPLVNVQEVYREKAKKEKNIYR